MIEVRVNGCSKNRELGVILKETTKLFIRELMPRKRRLFIRIQVIDKLLENEGVDGDCLADDCPEKGKHYEFIIRLNNNPDRQLILTTLAHEMAHVRQYATGTLRFFSGDSEISIWNGIKVDSRLVEYDQLPWEIDAVKTEKELTRLL